MTEVDRIDGETRNVVELSAVIDCSDMTNDEQTFIEDLARATEDTFEEFNMFVHASLFPDCSGIGEFEDFGDYLDGGPHTTIEDSERRRKMVLIELVRLTMVRRARTVDGEPSNVQ